MRITFFIIFFYYLRIWCNFSKFSLSLSLSFLSLCGQVSSTKFCQLVCVSTPKQIHDMYVYGKPFRYKIVCFYVKCKIDSGRKVLKLCFVPTKNKENKLKLLLQQKYAHKKYINRTKSLCDYKWIWLWKVRISRKKQSEHWDRIEQGICEQLYTSFFFQVSEIFLGNTLTKLLKKTCWLRLLQEEGGNKLFKAKYRNSLL